MVEARERTRPRGDAPMMWFFAILIVLAMGGVAAASRPGAGSRWREAYDDRPDVAGARRRAAERPTTCAGSGSPWPSAATGCPRSTRCSTGWPASANTPTPAAPVDGDLARPV